MGSQMTTQQPSLYAVLDSSFLVGYCAREKNKRNITDRVLLEYETEGRELYIPGIAAGEVIYTIARKHKDKELTDEEYDDAITLFELLSESLNQPLCGDTALIRRTAEIRKGYGEGKTYDSLFVALAENMLSIGTIELATFDKRMVNLAKAKSPGVNVRLFETIKEI